MVRCPAKEKRDSYDKDEKRLAEAWRHCKALQRIRAEGVTLPVLLE
jgi:hypothetical protein